MTQNVLPSDHITCGHFHCPVPSLLLCKTVFPFSCGYSIAVWLGSFKSFRRQCCIVHSETIWRKRLGFFIKPFFRKESIPSVVFLFSLWYFLCWGMVFGGSSQAVRRSAITVDFAHPVCRHNTQPLGFSIKLRFQLLFSHGHFLSDFLSF